MKKKYVKEIHFCNQCPNYFKGIMTESCEAKHNRSLVNEPVIEGTSNIAIPEWCPLDEFENDY